MRKLTLKQKEILSNIVVNSMIRLVQPTYRELAKHIGCVSTHNVSDHLEALQRKGYIRMSGGPNRSMLIEDKAIVEVLGLDTSLRYFSLRDHLKTKEL